MSDCFVPGVKFGRGAIIVQGCFFFRSGARPLNSSERNWPVLIADSVNSREHLWDELEPNLLMNDQD